MNGIRVGRLRRLAKHLRGTHRAHKKFDFGVVAQGKFINDNYCGSVGCALGELPAVWPKEWKWEQNYWCDDMFDVFLKTHNSGITNIWNPVSNFFSITNDQAYHLFKPRKQMPQQFGGKELDEYATAEQVADNIDAFIKKVAS